MYSGLMKVKKALEVFEVEVRGAIGELSLCLLRRGGSIVNMYVFSNIHVYYICV